MVDANSLRPGNIVLYRDTLYRVVTTQHIKQGRGSATVSAELRRLSDGSKLINSFRSDEDVERVRLDEKDYQFLFKDADDNLTLMDMETYEQITIPSDFAGDAIAFLQDNMMVTLDSYDGKPLSLRLPETVILTVDQADAVIKGQTATSSFKPAILENGVRVMVPPFVQMGDRIVVRTADATYVERAKDK